MEGRRVQNGGLEGPGHQNHCSFIMCLWFQQFSTNEAKRDAKMRPKSTCRRAPKKQCNSQMGHPGDSDPSQTQIQTQAL